MASPTRKTGNADHHLARRMTVPASPQRPTAPAAQIGGYLRIAGDQR